jgi:hypothetical protein
VQWQLDLVQSLGFAHILLLTETMHLRELDLPPGTRVLETSTRQDENFAAVKAAVSFGPDDRCLLLFGDSPLVSAPMVADFLARCRVRNADICHGLVPYVFVEPFMEFFPRSHVGRTPFHVAEFRARLGCLSLARPAAFDPRAMRSGIQTVMRGRKQDPGTGGLGAMIAARARVLWGGMRYMGPWGVWIGLAAIAAHWSHERGFPALARVLRRPVTLARLDEVATRLLGCPAAFVPCPFGGASLDIDSETDLEVHERHFDPMRTLQRLQERIVTTLADPAFELTPEQIDALARADPAAAVEIRRHPEIYREQQRILRLVPARPVR